MEGELNDVKDDLDTEKKDRQRAEKLRKDLSEELEALKTELEETTETGAVQQQVSISLCIKGLVTWQVGNDVLF